MKIKSLTPEPEILKELGLRLARMRKQQGYSQTRLADEAGVGVATIRRIEAGQDSQLESWVKILKPLNMIASVDALLPENFVSPMAQVMSDRKNRRKSKRESAGIIWGDERS